MLKLPKNAPEDEEFIKRANQDPDWPADIDKPVDWDTVPLWQKIWFRIRNVVAAILWVVALCGIAIALMEFNDAGNGMDEPSCTQSSRGCYDD